MKSVGIDIGHFSVKIVEVQHQGNSSRGVTITGLYEKPIGRNFQTDPNLEVLEFLREMAPQYDPEMYRIVFAMPQEMVSVRNKIFPFNDKVKILKSLPFEMEEDFPFNPDQSVYDAKIIKTMGNSAEVLACATPASRVAQILERAKDCGLEPHILPPEGAAFANIWENWNDSPPSENNTQFQLDGESRPERRVDLYLDIGHSHSLICALENGSLVGVRSLSWGGHALAKHLAEKYEITVSEAQNIVETKAFVLLSEEDAAYDQIVFSQTIAESLRELTRDIQMSILEFQREFNAVPKEVFVCGGLGRIPNLNAFLTQQLDLPVNFTKIITGRFNVASTAVGHLNERADSVYGVALGLAIEGLKKPRNPPLTFLRGAFQRQDRKTQDFFQKWGGLLKGAAAALVVLFIYSMTRDSMSADLNEKAGEALKVQAKAIARLPTKQANEGGVQKFLKDQKKRTESTKLVQAALKMPSALEVLRRISDSAPGRSNSQIQVTRVGIHGGHVEVEGYANGPADISALKQGLQSLAVGAKLGDAVRKQGAPAAKLPFAFAFDMDRSLKVKQ